ncbi:MAG: response regulator [Candidatus Omnitrophota bacterium]
MDRLKILLVDDEMDFLETMGAIIEGWGYGLITAANGKEAIDAVMAKKADIVVLDYMMPEMDGIAVLKEIRKIDKELSVIMFTAHPDIKAIKGTEKLGVSAFIPKLSVYSDTKSALKAALYMVEKRLKKE